jgi:hypothetical protein
MAAHDLLPGTTVTTAAGQRLEVERVDSRRGPTYVFNLEVEGLHTYHVGDAALLVHNGACRVERFERFGSRAEARSTFARGGLVPKPGHERQPKWIADEGVVRPRSLGQTKNYTHRMTFEAKPGTRMWLKESGMEAKPHNEPGRYAVPANLLDEFNRRVIRVRIGPR